MWENRCERAESKYIKQKFPIQTVNSEHDTLSGRVDTNILLLQFIYRNIWSFSVQNKICKKIKANKLVG